MLQRVTASHSDITCATYVLCRHESTTLPGSVACDGKPLQKRVHSDSATLLGLLLARVEQQLAMSKALSSHLDGLLLQAQSTETLINAALKALDSRSKKSRTSGDHSAVSKDPAVTSEPLSSGSSALSAAPAIVNKAPEAAASPKPRTQQLKAHPVKSRLMKYRSAKAQPIIAAACMPSLHSPTSSTFVNPATQPVMPVMPDSITALPTVGNVRQAQILAAQSLLAQTSIVGQLNPKWQSLLATAAMATLCGSNSQHPAAPGQAPQALLQPLLISIQPWAAQAPAPREASEPLISCVVSPSSSSFAAPNGIVAAAASPTGSCLVPESASQPLQYTLHCGDESRCAIFAQAGRSLQPLGTADAEGLTGVDDPLSWAAAAICAAAGSAADPKTAAAAETPGSQSYCHLGDSVSSPRCRTGKAECDSSGIQRCLSAAPVIRGHGGNSGRVRKVLSRSGSSSSTTTTDASSVLTPVAASSSFAKNGIEGVCV
ncbi:hypothetical protein VaNZ11_007741 [Volvox africanus]|uniref:Uncharacterized protein n=1 Tax=Volvox africanus TaxID=51714 RepID=A0ABQ5S4U8_9CHLO|nr:hypothetical protein VaNZ11_007741 [Volvox africanus]